MSLDEKLTETVNERKKLLEVKFDAIDIILKHIEDTNLQFISETKTVLNDIKNKFTMTINEEEAIIKKINSTPLDKLPDLLNEIKKNDTLGIINKLNDLVFEKKDELIKNIVTSAIPNYKAVHPVIRKLVSKSISEDSSFFELLNQVGETTRISYANALRNCGTFCLDKLLKEDNFRPSDTLVNSITKKYNVDKDSLNMLLDYIRDRRINNQEIHARGMKYHLNNEHKIDVSWKSVGDLYLACAEIGLKSYITKKDHSDLIPNSEKSNASDAYTNIINQLHHSIRYSVSNIIKMGLENNTTFLELTKDYNDTYPRAIKRCGFSCLVELYKNQSFKPNEEILNFITEKYNIERENLDKTLHYVLHKKTEGKHIRISNLKNNLLLKNRSDSDVENILLACAEVGLRSFKK